MSGVLPQNIDETAELLRSGGYIAGRDLATSVFLALKLKRPIFLEGEAGVGKTELAKVLATQLRRDLLRLQCYEGLDTASAVYEWNAPRQMMAIRLSESVGQAPSTQDIYTDEHLIRRPLLKALETQESGPPVLLIDELDRTDEPFEAFLLEILSDYQITIPELGPVKAESPPIVVITSNRTREVHDALKRRCLYHWLDYPSAERERAILKVRMPEAGEKLGAQIVHFVQTLRGMDLFKAPGLAETLDWSEALLALGSQELDLDTVDRTLGVVLKYQDDLASARSDLAATVEAARAAAE